MKRLFTIISIFISTALSAQHFDVSGVVTDEEGKGLPAATVMLMNAEDSTLANFTVADDNGSFLLKKATAKHFLKITFIGFLPGNINLQTPDGQILNLGAINLRNKSTQLDEVTVKGEHVPVTIKKDTIEFNARAFKTQNNAVVEDLLKQLPGVEVDNDGGITAQGETVQKVTVDGKEFFGRDPKLATRNLPADAVEKVQVIDGKSEQARFSGIDDGKREKQINLELKEDRKNGAFGTASAGAGTENRYEGKANINRFSKGDQLSVLGMANNTNQQGFSISEYMNFTGASNQMMSGGGGRITISASNNGGIPLDRDRGSNGIMSTLSGGVNMNKSLGKDLDVNGSYFVNHLDHDISQTLLRENFQPDPSGNYNYYEDGVQNRLNTNHRGNITMDYALDSANSLRFNGNLSHSNTIANGTGSSKSVRNDGELQNESSQLTTSTGTVLNTSGNLLYRHRFAKKGRTISVDSEFGYSNNDTDGSLAATNSFYGPMAYDMQLNQEYVETITANALGTSISYTEPLGGRKYLEASYRIRNNRNIVDKSVYDLANDQREYNEQLSNSYQSDYLYQRAGLNLRVNRQDYNFTVGVGYQDSKLQGQLVNTEIEKDFTNILPVARFNYELSGYTRLNLDYETSVQEPTIQQLQPVVDNRNPLNIYEGNPQLQPAYRHNIRFSFNSFNPMKFLGLLSFIDVAYTDNAITTAQTIDDQFVRYNKPINVDKSLNISANTHLSFPLTFIKSRINIGATYTNSQYVSILNDVESDISQNTVSLNVRYSLRLNDIFDLSLSTEQNRQVSKYELDQPDQAFLNSTYKGEANLTFLKNYTLTTETDYNTFENKELDFNEDILMVNLSLARSFLKDNKGELKLSVVNLLDENLGVSQSAGLNYVEHQVTNSIGRYFMMSFTYSINKHLNPVGGRGKGGIMIRR